MSRLTSSLRALLLSVTLSLGFTGCATAQGYYDNPNGDDGSYQTFYDELSPYGEWINDPDYGYVWVPDAGDDFRPYYSNGYWVNTEYGNTWYSNYAWGWAPFHYGRWTYSPYYGWMWIPGNVWGPAWVSWRSGGGCYGWAPLGPGITISMSFGSGYYVPDYWWVFTPQRYILSHNFYHYTYGPRYNSRYLNQTTIINNTYVYNHTTYVSGPRRGDMERAIGRPIQQATITGMNRPGRSTFRSNTLQMYRPAIAETAPRSNERPRVARPSNMPIQRIENGQQQTPVNRNVGPTQQQSPWRQQVQRPSGTTVSPNRQQEVITQPNQQQIQPDRNWNRSEPSRNVQQNEQPAFQRPAPQNQQWQRPNYDRPQRQAPAPRVERQSAPQIEHPSAPRMERMESPRPAAPARMERAGGGGGQEHGFRR